MATTAREGTIPAARGNEKRDRVVWIPSSISTHHMINKTPSSSLPPTTTHHIKKTPTKSSSSSGSRSTTQRSTVITTSVHPTSDKPIPNALRRPIRLDPSKKEARDKTSTSRSNTHGSSSALQKPSLNGRRLFDKPPPSARLLKHSIRGSINATSDKLTVRYSPSFTSKTGSVSASSSRFSARPAPVDRRKYVPSPPSSVLKPRTRSSDVSKSGSTHLSSASKKDATAGGTMNCWKKKKKKNGPKNGTSESNIEVERQKDQLGGSGGHHLVTEVSDDEGSSDNNNNHDEQVESLPDMSEMPCVNKEHLGDPNLTDLHEVEIIKTSDHHDDHISVGDNDDENLLQPTSQDEDELVGNDRKTRDPEEEAESTVITKEGAINTSDVDNEGQDRVRKTIEPADHDQHTEAMPEQGEAADQKKNMEAEDEERSKSEIVGSELDGEEVVSEEADSSGGEKTDDDAVVVVAGEETKKMTSSSNNNHKREGEGEVGSAGGGSNLMKKKKKKKDRQEEVYNDVIEETSKKLMDQNRQNKVKALAGAFETVISLQDNNSKASN